MVSEIQCRAAGIELTEDDLLHMKEMVSLIIYMMKTALAQDDYVESLSFEPSMAFELDTLFTYLSECNRAAFERDEVCQYGAHVADCFRYTHQQYAVTQRVESFDVVFSAFIIFVAAVAGMFAHELREGAIRITDDDVQRFALCRKDIADLAQRPCPTVAHLLDEFNINNIIRLNISNDVLH